MAARQQWLKGESSLSATSIALVASKMDGSIRKDEYAVSGLLKNHHILEKEK